MNSGEIRSSMDEIYLPIDRMHSYSSLRSIKMLKLETIFIQNIRSFGLSLCTCSLIINWLRLGFIYLFPKYYPNLIQSSSNLCIIESFFLHVLTCFHLYLIIFLRLYWHYCFLLDDQSRKLSYHRVLCIILFIFIFICLLTLPTISHEWASITYDENLHICIVNYLFNYSYTFFVVTFTCIIPFITIIISHKLQMNVIMNRISKRISKDELLNVSQSKIRFQYSSYILLIVSLINILLLILLHIPIQYRQIRTVFYYMQIFSLLLDPIIYMFIYHSLSIITLLRSSNGIYFI